MQRCKSSSDLLHGSDSPLLFILRLAIKRDFLNETVTRNTVNAPGPRESRSDGQDSSLVLRNHRHKRGLESNLFRVAIPREAFTLAQGVRQGLDRFDPLLPITTVRSHASHLYKQIDLTQRLTPLSL